MAWRPPLFAEVGDADQRVVHGHPGAFQGHAVAQETLRAGRRRKRAGDARDTPVPAGEQVLDCLHGARQVIGDDSVRGETGQLPVGENDVDTGVNQRPQICGGARRREDYPGHVLGYGKLEVACFFRRIFVRVAEEHRVPGFVRAILYAPHEVGKERARPDVRDDQRPDSVVPEPEATRHPVGAVVQLANRPGNLCHEVRGDPLVPVQDARDG